MNQGTEARVKDYCSRIVLGEPFEQVVSEASKLLSILSLDDLNLAVDLLSIHGAQVGIPGADAVIRRTVRENKPANDILPRMSAASAMIIDVPDTPWLCEGMEIGPGRPCQFVGVGGSGKTYCVMDFGFAVASGGLFLGHKCRKGKVLHINYELGRKSIQRRMKKLCAGRGISQKDAERYEVVSLPPFYLNDPNAYQTLLRNCAGYDLVIIDSLRRATPGEEENSSKMSNYLDILTRVSDELGCTVIVIHHSGKGSPDDLRFILRGSSAILDASGSVWAILGADNPRRAVQVRAHDDGQGGCTPVHFGISGDKQRLELRTISKADVEREANDEAREAVKAYVAAHPGIGARELRDSLPRTQTFEKAVASMRQDGTIVVQKQGAKLCHFLVGAGDSKSTSTSN